MKNGLHFFAVFFVPVLLAFAPVQARAKDPLASVKNQARAASVTTHILAELASDSEEQVPGLQGAIPARLLVLSVERQSIIARKQIHSHPPCEFEHTGRGPPASL